MYGGKDVEVANRIGHRLLAVLPQGADRITAKAEAGDDWAEVGFEYCDAAGNIGHFTFESNPDDAADEICVALMELHEVMTASGTGDWNRAEFTTNRDGQFTFRFSYDKPETES
jgi:hypothetical protein